MERLDRTKMTCPSTPHFVRLEIVFPGNMIFEPPSPIVLRPIRLTNDGYTEFKYSATIENRHPPCLGKEPYAIELDTVQSYHQDGRIDTTTIRVVILDPTRDKCKVDLTTRAWGGKVERKQDERKNEQSSSSSPQRNTCPYCANIHDGEVTAIYFDFDLTLHLHHLTPTHRSLHT